MCCPLYGQILAPPLQPPQHNLTNKTWRWTYDDRMHELAIEVAAGGRIDHLIEAIVMVAHDTAGALAGRTSRGWRATRRRALRDTEKQKRTHQEVKG